MKMNRAGLTSLVFAFGILGGCGGGAAEKKPVAAAPAVEEKAPAPEPEPADQGDRVLATMSDFKDDVCACTSAECIEGVQTKMMEWAMANMDELNEIKPTPAQDAEADRIEAEMDACKARYGLAPTAPVSAKLALTPLPPGGTGSKACDEYLSLFDQIVLTCARQLGPSLEAMVQSRNGQVEAFAEWGKLDPESKKATIEAADTGCRAATDAIRQAFAAMDCKP